MIIGLDLGNLTTTCIGEEKEITFESRLKEFQDIDNFTDKDIFEIDNKKFVMEEGYFENNLIKHDKENFINLVYYAIGKVTNEPSIKLVIGIPAGQYNYEKENLRKVILKQSCKSIKINGELKTITIEDVFVVPEGYGIKVEALQDLNNKNKTLVIDIGGGTTDIAEFNESNKFIGGKSIKTGLLDMYKNIVDIVDSRYKLNITLEDARKYFDGELVIRNEKFEEETAYKKEALKNMLKILINDIRGIYSNITQYNIILSGGGAKISNSTFLKLYPQTKAIEDIKANAKGFRKVGIAKWQKK
ncbi:MAG: Plasmid segregation protein ParM/StbA domain-containing protein [uncultured Clostridium sp.]